MAGRWICRTAKPFVSRAVRPIPEIDLPFIDGLGLSDFAQVRRAARHAWSHARVQGSCPRGLLRGADPRSLIAVTARSNQQKADKDPTDYLPVTGYVCRYISDWVTVKTRWDLAADPAEAATLASKTGSCENEPITVELAR
jgi:hypothetical protein